MPGCYPTAALLALAPLQAAGLLEAGIVVDAKSGISGAGKAPTDRTHFCENHGSVAAYGVFSHRHAPEIEQELGMEVTFVPHLVPLDRGILESIYVSLRRGTTESQVAETLQDAYTSAPFVRLTGAELPEIKHVAHTNFCDIGWRVDEATRASGPDRRARQPVEGRGRSGGSESEHHAGHRSANGAAVKRRDPDALPCAERDRWWC